MQKCVICGKEIERSQYTNKVICSSECYEVDFWNDMLLIKDDPNTVRIDGTHYIIGYEKQDGGFRGFCGRKFKIEFFDGRIIDTTNLWYQGEIKEGYKELLPDNAKFIAEAESNLI